MNLVTEFNSHYKVPLSESIDEAPRPSIVSEGQAKRLPPLTPEAEKRSRALVIPHLVFGVQKVLGRFGQGTGDLPDMLKLLSYSIFHPYDPYYAEQMLFTFFCGCITTGFDQLDYTATRSFFRGLRSFERSCSGSISHGVPGSGWMESVWVVVFTVQILD